VHQFQKVLVGIDWTADGPEESFGLSPADREAVETALELGEQGGAEITFCSIIDSADLPADLQSSSEAALDDEIRPSLDAKLIGLAEHADKRGVSARACVVYGTVWLELVREVLREDYNLVIIGASDRSGDDEARLSPIADKLLHNSPCATWIVKPRSNSEDFFVLVASDLSEFSADVVQRSVALGQWTDAKPRLLHAVEEDAQPVAELAEVAEIEETELCEKRRKEAENNLWEQLSATDYRTLTYGMLVHIVDGPADMAIRHAIDEFQIDLLIMGTGGGSGISGQLGQTAERLLPHISCSLLALKPDEFQSPVTLE